MKKLPTIFVTFLFSILYVQGQNLSLEDLVTLRRKDAAIVEEFLSSNGWSMLSSEQGEDSDLSILSFAYNKSSFDDKAEAFLSYYFNLLGTHRIDLQIHKKEKYTLYLNKIKSLGCKLVNSKIENNEMIKAYRGKTTTFLVRLRTEKKEYQDSTSTFYYITVVSNEDYDDYFSEKFSN